MRPSRLLPVVLAVAALAGCSSVGPTPVPRTTEAAVGTTPAATAPADTAVAEASSADAAPADPGDDASKAGPAGDPPILLSKSASSAAYGDSWTVRKVVRHFPPPASLPGLKRREIVAVKLRITSGAKYYTLVGPLSFTLFGDDGQERSPSTIVDVDLAGAGLTPPLQDVRQGGTGEGWVTFILDHPESRSLTLRYNQMPAKVRSTGLVIPAKKIDLRLIG
jgi:hypothetical protein